MRCAHLVNDYIDYESLKSFSPNQLNLENINKFVLKIL